MFALLRRILGVKRDVSAMRSSYGIKDDALYDDNTDVLAGMEFTATLQLRTPLCVLEHHGEVIDAPPSRVPTYGSDADGCWIPKTKSWSELGIAVREAPESSAASDIGLVKPSEYVPFLIAFRGIVESSLEHERKLERIEALASQSALFSGFWARHRANNPDFPHSYFYRELTSLPGVGRMTANALYEAGFRSTNAIREASDDALLAVKGVGPKLVAAVKAAV